MRQLVRRLQLTGRRRLSTHALAKPWFTPTGANAPPLRQSLPRAIFAPRTELVTQHDHSYFLSQHGAEFSLSPPVDWYLRGVPHTHLQRLTLHYHEFLESLPLELGQQIILDWIEKNPPLQPRYWLDSWNSYAISIRTVCWMQWLARFPHHPTPTTHHPSPITHHPSPITHHPSPITHPPTPITTSLVAQIRFLIRNLETDICGNHLIKNIRCLLWAAAFFEGDEPLHWQELGLRLLRQELRRQFLSDGMHYELSPAYHCQVVGDLLESAAVLPRNDAAWLLDELRPALRALEYLTHPDRLISLFSDGGLHMVYSPDTIFDAARIIRVSSHQLAVGPGISKPAPQSDSSSTIANHQEIDATASASSQALSTAGYYRWCNDQQWLLVDCGPVCEDSLPAHGHADMLSFEWDVMGERVIVDNGVYQYEAGVNRHYDRSVICHNTVQVGTNDQAELVGSFRTGRRSRATCEQFSSSDQSFHLIGSHDGFVSGDQRWRHRRAFRATEGTLVIEDEVQLLDTSQRNNPPLASSTDHDDNAGLATARFLFHDQCVLKSISEQVVQIKTERALIRLTANCALKILPATWSPDFGIRKQTHRVEAVFPSTAEPVRFEFTVEK